MRLLTWRAWGVLARLIEITQRVGRRSRLRKLPVGVALGVERSITNGFTVGVDPSETWMVGDNLEADITMPLALGMHTIWIDEAGAGIPDEARVKPHRVIRTVQELMTS